LQGSEMRLFIKNPFGIFYFNLFGIFYFNLCLHGITFCQNGRWGLHPGAGMTK
jgi:hypothetical protein